MKVKVFRKERKFDIIDASMATYLHGAGPNPVYFTGAVGGRFSVLGGLVKIAFNDEEIEEFIGIINRIAQDHPILVDKYLQGKEIEVVMKKV